MLYINSYSGNFEKTKNKVALWVLKKLYKEGIYYQKAGVMPMELVPSLGQQADLFGLTLGDSKSAKLMEL